ncbi:hypothetical protein [Pedobacter sp. MW01-1-1]|uniref:hypothetical protein n=1 Tax=Pedobacter sp. MW01-1-1 TaxID=3383027 RepID=UPI003FED8D85
MMKLFNDSGKMGYRHTAAFNASKGRTESTKELYEFEVDHIIIQLQKLAPKQSSISEAYPERKKMRGKIIHELCLLGYVDKNGKPDFNRIDRFIVNIGSRNPRKVILNYLYPNELKAVLNQVETMYKKELNR